MASAVSAVATNGLESPRARSSLLFAQRFALEGPFPHPVRDHCRLRLTTDVGSSEEALRVEIRRLTGERLRSLWDGAIVPGSTVDLAWDRKDERGAAVAPGYYFVVVLRGGEREIRTIYVSP